MAKLSKQEIINALERLGQLAQKQDYEIELMVVGGAAMVLAYGARQSTHDVDVVILQPREARIARELAKKVARELDWDDGWLNDAAKGYVVGLSEGQVLLSAQGIKVRAPAVEQLLAMKLSAWRDDVDIADARRLLEELAQHSERDQIWQKVEPYLVRGDELKAQYAFQDLWETLYGNR
jgi:predicted nucleotidyltransferase